MSLESAIKATEEYARGFGCSLTREETEERLLSDVSYQLSVIGYRFKQKNDNKYYEVKMKSARKLAEKHLSKFGNILMVAVTGSVASKYPKRGDDIDLLVVTKKDCLWPTRLAVRCYIKLWGIPHRRWEEKHEKNKFCFNMWLDEEHLEIDKKNLKNAVDLVLMRPVVEKNCIYGKMMKANVWARKYVATGYQKKMSDVRCQISERTENRNRKLDKLINWVCFWPQYWFMKSKIKGERVGLGWAYFHPKG